MTKAPTSRYLKLTLKDKLALALNCNSIEELEVLVDDSRHVCLMAVRAPCARECGKKVEFFEILVIFYTFYFILIKFLLFFINFRLFYS